LTFDCLGDLGVTRDSVLLFFEILCGGLSRLFRRRLIGSAKFLNDIPIYSDKVAIVAANSLKCCGQFNCTKFIAEED
jgi:hypothetical protein